MAAQAFIPFMTKGVDVSSDPRAGAIVCIGDSITEGLGSTKDRNLRYPDDLSARLAQSPLKDYSVVNLGIAGNQILHSPSANPASNEALLLRFDRDALHKSGVKYVILLEGINDILHADGNRPDQPPIAPDQGRVITDAYTALAKKAHAAGVKIYIGTLTPSSQFRGMNGVAGALRHNVNAWIRGPESNVFDGVIDFDQAVAVPNRIPEVYKSGLNSPDGLHPNDDGYAAMAGAVKLSLF